MSYLVKDMTCMENHGKPELYYLHLIIFYWEKSVKQSYLLFIIYNMFVDLFPSV